MQLQASEDQLQHTCHILKGFFNGLTLYSQLTQYHKLSPGEWEIQIFAGILKFQESLDQARANEVVVYTIPRTLKVTNLSFILTKANIVIFYRSILMYSLF